MKYVFWFFFILVNVKIGYVAIDWVQTEKEDREPFWDVVKRDVFGIKK